MKGKPLSSYLFPIYLLVNILPKIRGGGIPSLIALYKLFLSDIKRRILAIYCRLRLSHAITCPWPCSKHFQIL